jgi:hypothetical protein
MFRQRFYSHSWQHELSGVFRFAIRSTNFWKGSAGILAMSLFPSSVSEAMPLKSFGSQLKLLWNDWACAAFWSLATSTTSAQSEPSRRTAASAKTL